MATARRWRMTRVGPSSPPKTCSWRPMPGCEQAVAGAVRLNWAPEQIDGWLKKPILKTSVTRVTREIYRSIFVQARGVLERAALPIFGRGRTIRRSKQRVSSARDGDNHRMSSDSVKAGSGLKIGLVAWHWKGDSASGSKKQLYRDHANVTPT